MHHAEGHVNPNVRGKKVTDFRYPEHVESGHRAGAPPTNFFQNVIWLKLTDFQTFTGYFHVFQIMNSCRTITLKNEIFQKTRLKYVYLVLTREKFDCFKCNTRLYIQGV
jgi:hypothetical protein